jgi:23S rRNA (guanine745-N1)-methyltransferase
MLREVLTVLRCPHCGADLARDGRVVRCAQGHAFDIARQGYVNLLPAGARAGTADTAAMVAARADFLAADHFAPLSTALAQQAQQCAPAEKGCVVDIGAGTGHHLSAVLDALPGWTGLALDVSKYAMRRAARCHPRAGAAVCDVWTALPVVSGAAGLVLDVFAPRNAAEIARILRPDGALLVVTPQPNHLGEAVTALGLISVEPGKLARLDADLSPLLRLERRVPLRFTMHLDHAAVATLVGMGPSARHLDTAVLTERIGALPVPATVTAAVDIAVYRLA